jgi:hypothetical protein
MSEFVSIAAYNDVALTESARAKLEAVGIPTQFTDGEIVSEEWLQANALGSVKLQVRESDVERALQILGGQAELEAGIIGEDISDEELERQAMAEEPEGED